MKVKRSVKKMLLIIPIALLCIIIIAWASAYIYFKGGNNINAQAFQKRFDVATAPMNIHESVLFIENSTGDFSEIYTYGGRSIDSPMVVASVTKMFTTTCIIKLVEENRLSLADKISLYIDNDILSGLHVYKGVEYSFDITVSDLLYQTSGLPDYFTNSELVKNAIYNQDVYLTFEQYTEETKKLSPRFAPNSGKAYYADINFDILGVILENVMSLPLDEIYKQYIFEPLGMINTYLPVNEDDFVPHLYNASERIERPLLIASFRASGGCISTARDMMVFNKAFWNGEIFDKAILETLSGYNKLQFEMTPITYGGGYMGISLNGINTFFLAKGNLMGHSGSTGSLLFYYPERDLFFIGDFAQIENPGLSVRFAIMLAMVTK